ncbi:unnamed protein product [Rhizophagus irregularis]|nr:unnamed protein product [Rhizophagus irregularis]
MFPSRRDITNDIHADGSTIWMIGHLTAFFVETSDLDERIGTPDSDSLMKPDLTLMRDTIPFFFDFIGIKPTGPNDSAQIIINNRLKRNLKLLKGNKFSDCDE